MNITVRNMEIDLNSNIPQLMLGVLFFQGGTVRQYISAAKYMIILKPLQLGVPNFHTLTQKEHKVAHCGSQREMDRNEGLSEGRVK